MLTALVAGVTLLTACHPPATEAPDPSSTPAAGAPSAVRDQSTVFFPGAGDSYGVAVDQTDRDHLTELAALRKIDPCGFVAAENAGRADDGRAALGGRAYSYTYNAVSNLLVGGDRLHTLGGNACAVALSDSKIGLLLTVNPGDPQGYTGSTPLTPDPEHPGVTKTTSWGKCTYRVRLPLTAMAGAPPSMQDPMLQVTPMSDGTWELEDTSRCDLAGALAGDAAALVSNRGVPVFTDKASAAAWYLSSDPCAAAEDLSAQRFRWDDPHPGSQWPTTWRHPGTCQLDLGTADSGPDVRLAVIRRGLAIWPQLAADLVEPGTGQPAAKTQRYGIDLYSLSSGGDQSCKGFVVAKAADVLPVVNVGGGAPGLSAPTPTIVVDLIARGGANCNEVATTAAVAAMKRGLR